MGVAPQDSVIGVIVAEAFGGIGPTYPRAGGHELPAHARQPLGDRTFYNDFSSVVLEVSGEELGVESAAN